MLAAALLSRPEERHSYYPVDIWAYLNSVPQGKLKSEQKGAGIGGMDSGRSYGFPWIYLSRSKQSLCSPALTRQTKDSIWRY